MPRKSRHASAIDFLVDRFVGNDPERIASFEGAQLNMNIAQQIYDLRTAAGLTQRQLASKVGTSASVICQLEASDYAGHSVSMLQRIASALSARIELRFVPVRRHPSSSPARKKRRVA